MQHNISKHFRNNDDKWKNRAFQILRRETSASRDYIQSFINQNWQKEDTDDENIFRFQTYMDQAEEIYACQNATL